MHACMCVRWGAGPGTAGRECSRTLAVGAPSPPPLPLAPSHTHRQPHTDPTHAHSHIISNQDHQQSSSVLTTRTMCVVHLPFLPFLPFSTTGHHVKTKGGHTAAVQLVAFNPSPSRGVHSCSEGAPMHATAWGDSDCKNPVWIRSDQITVHKHSSSIGTSTSTVQFTSGIAHSMCSTPAHACLGRLAVCPGVPPAVPCLAPSHRCGPQHGPA